MFYFDCKINVVDIIVDLTIVIITTGITYYLFSVLPAKNRFKVLKERLVKFKEELNENILDSENEFKKSYKLYEETVIGKENGEDTTLIWSLIKIKDWSKFLETFRYLTLLNIYFNDYWQGKELMLLVNSLVMDNNKYIDLSMNLSKLSAQISHTQSLLGDKTDNIWEIEHMHQLIKDKEENELIHLAVTSMEAIYETSNELVQIINKIT